MKKTEWFSPTIDPTYEGNYEVELDSWPWPTLVNWTKKSGWAVGDPAIIKRWRGIVKEEK